MRKFIAARSIFAGSRPTLMFTTASTLTLMKSAFGTGSDVFTSTWMSSSVTLSSRSRNGMRMFAEPITTRRFRPEMMYAMSGGAFT